MFTEEEVLINAFTKQINEDFIKNIENFFYKVFKDSNGDSLIVNNLDYKMSIILYTYLKARNIHNSVKIGTIFIDEEPTMYTWVEIPSHIGTLIIEPAYHILHKTDFNPKNMITLKSDTNKSDFNGLTPVVTDGEFQLCALLIQWQRGNDEHGSRSLEYVLEHIDTDMVKNVMFNKLTAYFEALRKDAIKL